MTEPNQLEVGMRACLVKMGVASGACPFPIYWTVIDSCWSILFLIFISILYLCIKIINSLILVYMMHETEHNWLFNMYKKYFI